MIGRNTRTFHALTLSMLMLASCAPPLTPSGSPVVPASTTPAPAEPSALPTPTVTPPSAPAETTLRAALQVTIPSGALSKMRAPASMATKAWQLLAGPTDPTQADFDGWRVQVNGKEVASTDMTYSGPFWDDQGRFVVTLTLQNLPTAPFWRVELSSPSQTFRLVTVIHPHQLGTGGAGAADLSPASTSRTLLADRLAALGHPDLAVPPEAVDLLQVRLDRALADSSGDPLTVSLVVGPLIILADAIADGVDPAALARLPGIAPVVHGGGSGVSLRGIITTLAGNGATAYAPTHEGIAATAAAINRPTSIVVDTAGNIYIADSHNHRVRKVAAGTGIITTIAGTGTPGTDGNGGLATAAKLNWPQALAIDTDGNLYIAERTGSVVRKVDAVTGTISPVAGDNTIPFNYDPAHEGGSATSAALKPLSLAIDGIGNLIIADTPNHRIRVVCKTPGTYFGVPMATAGNIYTVAGTGLQPYDVAHDGAAATLANLNNPGGITLDAAGNLYIADSDNQRIRKVVAGTGIITTIAGTGTVAYDPAHDGGPATAANIGSPQGLAIDGSGHLFICDHDNHRIRRVDAVTGTISTVAGSAANGYNPAHEGIVATAASLKKPWGVWAARDGSGMLLIADHENDRVRRVF